MIEFERNPTRRTTYKPYVNDNDSRKYYSLCVCRGRVVCLSTYIKQAVNAEQRGNTMHTWNIQSSGFGAKAMFQWDEG